MKNEIELLTQLVRDGKIKKGDIPEDHYNEIIKNIKEQYVRAFHQKSICVDKTGRWRTKVTDPVTNKRRSIAKPTREELIGISFTRKIAVLNLYPLEGFYRASLYVRC